MNMYYPKMHNFATVQGAFFLNSASASLFLRFHFVVCMEWAQVFEYHRI